MEMHEVLLTRGDFPKGLQYLIWSRYNCILLHPACHQTAATKENKLRLIRALCKLEGQHNIDAWLLSILEYARGTQIEEARRILLGV